MKTLMFTMMVVALTAQAEFNVDTNREVMSSSYKTQSPAGEQVQCFPAATVKKWAERKKKAAAKPAVVEKTVEKIVEKVVERTTVEEYPRNSISLIGGRTETGLAGAKAVSASSIQLKSTTTGEFDLGLQYQRRIFDRWRLSGIMTKNGSAYLGIGYDF